MSKRIKVAETNQLASNQGMLVKVQGRHLALFNVDGKYYAIDNACTHSGGPLAEGRLFGTTVTCPWHGAQFNVTSGEYCSRPATANVRTYPIHIEGYSIFVEVQ